jgi:hypothetical protein
MADQEAENEKKKQDTPREADSGGNMGAGKSGKEGMGTEKPSGGPGLGSQKPGQPRS